MTRRPDIFADLPTVYAVGKNYIIIVPVNEPCLMWVRVGDEEFYDDSNGILRSARLTHKMTVPTVDDVHYLRYTLDAARQLGRLYGAMA